MTYYLEDLTRLVRTKVIVCECGCWYWTGACNHHGYPRFELRKQSWLVHRYAYDRLVGPIPDDMTLDHLQCTSHRCIHPGHMQVVTRSENSERANRTRWHDQKFDEHGNVIDKATCEACAERDKLPSPRDAGPKAAIEREWSEIVAEAGADNAVGLGL